MDDASTQAQVSVIAYGTTGHSDPIPLGEAAPGEEIFKQGEEAEFPVSLWDSMWLYVRLWYLQYASNGDITVLH